MRKTSNSNSLSGVNYEDLQKPSLALRHFAFHGFARARSANRAIKQIAPHRTHISNRHNFDGITTA
jgi:hypothetical protein